MYVSAHSTHQDKHTLISTSLPHLHRLSAHSCPRSFGGSRKTSRHRRPSCPCSAWSWSCVSSCCSWSPCAPPDSSDTSLKRSWGENGSSSESRCRGSAAVHSHPAEEKRFFYIFLWMLVVDSATPSPILLF